MISREAYWNHPFIVETLVAQLRGRNAVLRYIGGVRRNCGYVEEALGFKGPIRIERHGRDMQDPPGLRHWVFPDLLEVHTEIGLPDAPGLTDRVVVDLDTYGEVPWDLVARTAIGVFQTLDCALPITDLALRFTGNRGIHIVGMLPKERDLMAVRSLITRDLIAASPAWKIAPETGLRFKHPRDKEEFVGILVDLAGMWPRHPVRCLGSLHAKTGRVCVQIGGPEDLPHFEPWHSDVDYVLGYPEMLKLG